MHFTIWISNLTSLKSHTPERILNFFCYHMLNFRIYHFLFLLLQENQKPVDPLSKFSTAEMKARLVEKYRCSEQEAKMKTRMREISEMVSQQFMNIPFT